ncbi:hemerythrin domain-containing protein [Cohnella silvisoli]|uniref:Hemerythrin domain-containing protein n=1 Tax=Cohnella silvisoli TaxID=2873699 RepID=A0ABV1KLK6_9BACL|nr:hemerythrin domain-containing protein [Cohnella silvisoli]MCD9020686.1 hemerythrin domain-containing protein [Cohnella silvisoli]
MTQQNSPLLELYLTYDQWKEEHDTLHGRLLELCRLMKWNPGNYVYPDWSTHHRKVRESFLPFMRDWQQHLAKERKMIYPIAKSAICGGPMGPVAVLEQDGRIVDQFYEAYLQATEEGASPEDALCRLLQVLMIIAEHFRVEDEIVVPATERLMDEIEYSGS